MTMLPGFVSHMESVTNFPNNALFSVVVALWSVKQLYLVIVSKNLTGSLGFHIIMTPTNTFYYFWVVYILIVIILHH